MVGISKILLRMNKHGDEESHAKMDVDMGVGGGFVRSCAVRA